MILMPSSIPYLYIKYYDLFRIFIICFYLLPQESQLVYERSQAGFESLESLPESLQIIRHKCFQHLLYLVPPGVPVVHLDLRVLLVVEIAPLEGLLHELPRGMRSTARSSS